MRKLVVFIASLGLLAALVPAVAAARGGSPSPAAVDAPAKVDPHLDQLIAAGNDAELTVFVHATATERAVAAAEAAGLRVFDTFERIDVAVAVGDPRAVRAVADQPDVLFVEADRPITFGLQTSHIATRGAEARTVFQESGTRDSDGDAATGPGRSERAGERGAHGRSRAPGGGNGGGSTEPAFEDEIDGSGISIAIVDSGIDGTHRMFQTEAGSKVVRNVKLACFYLVACAGPDREAIDALWLDLTDLGNDTDSPSAGGHGTHVAAIAAGVDVVTADGRELHGAAPGAHLVGISVGQALSVYGGAAGLNWVLTHHRTPCGDDVDPADCPPIRVVNNSWGVVGGGEFNPSSVSARLQDELVKDGVVVVWANGNDGGNGTDNRSNPEAQSPTGGILGVANYSDGNTGTREGGLHSTSSRGEQGRPSTYPDLSAPGSDITAACRTQLAVCNSLDEDQDYGTIGGTSMAAPHVAGIVAQLLQVRPDLSPAQVEYVLEVTAHPFASGGPYEPDPRNPDSRASFAAGHGLVDAVEAIAHVLDVTAPTAPVECEPDGPVVIDGTGDAIGLIFETPLPSEPSLDIVEGRLDWGADDEELTFTIQVLDLAESNPSGTSGIAFDFFFSHAGAGYYLLATRSDTDTEPTSFVLGRLETTRETLVSGLPGAFDPDDDTITITVPNDRLGDVGGDLHVPPFADGDVLGGFEIVSRRQFGAAGRGFIPDADSAGGSCPYTIGLGAVAPPPAPDDDEGPVDPGEPVEELEPPEEADHAVGPSWPDAAWEGFTVSPTNGMEFGPEPCREVVPDGGCADTTWLFVTAPGEVTITVSGMLPGDDWDVYVYDEGGVQVGTGEEPGDESITLTLPAGLYEVVVTPWLAASGGYSATAAWSG